VNLQHAPIAGGQVQAVDVLRDQREAVAQALLQLDQGVMTGVRPDAAHRGAAEVVEAPHQGGVVREGVRGGDVLDAVALP